jgi:hypothetical protein
MGKSDQGPGTFCAHFTAKVTQMTLLDTTSLKRFILSELLQKARIVDLICLF